MSAGKRDTLIGFERSTPTQNSSGEQVEHWAAYGFQSYAQVFWGRGEERRQAAAEQRVQTATFAVLSSPTTRGVTITDRIIGAGGTWNITGIAPGRRRGEIEFTAARSG